LRHVVLLVGFFKVQVRYILTFDNANQFFVKLEQVCNPHEAGRYTAEYAKLFRPTRANPVGIPQLLRDVYLDQHPILFIVDHDLAE